MDKKLTLTGLRDHMEKKHGRKSTAKPFTVSDIQGYINRGRIPTEYGGERIVLDEALYKQSKVKLYTLEK